MEGEACYIDSEIRVDREQSLNVFLCKVTAREIYKHASGKAGSRKKRGRKPEREEKIRDCS